MVILIQIEAKKRMFSVKRLEITNFLYIKYEFQIKGSRALVSIVININTLSEVQIILIASNQKHRQFKLQIHKHYLKLFYKNFSLE